MKNLSDKTKVEIMVGKLVIFLLKSVIAFGALLIGIWLVCQIYNFVLIHTWAFIVLGIVDIILFIVFIIRG